MRLEPCETVGCNTIVADPSERFCRSCRAKRASVAEELPRLTVKTRPLVTDALGNVNGFYGKGPPPRLQPVGTVLGFSIIPGISGKHILQSAPQRPFKPLGLIVWSTDPGARVERVSVGQQVVAPINGASIPAGFFSSAKSFEEIDEQVKAGTYPPSALGWPVCNLGNMITLEVDGRIDDACVWGLVIS